MEKKIADLMMKRNRNRLIVVQREHVLSLHFSVSAFLVVVHCAEQNIESNTTEKTTARS